MLYHFQPITAKVSVIWVAKVFRFWWIASSDERSAQWRHWYFRYICELHAHLKHAQLGAISLANNPICIHRTAEMIWLSAWLLGTSKWYIVAHKFFSDCFLNVNNVAVICCGGNTGVFVQQCKSENADILMLSVVEVLLVLLCQKSRPLALLKHYLLYEMNTAVKNTWLLYTQLRHQHSTVICDYIWWGILVENSISYCVHRHF